MQVEEDYKCSTCVKKIDLTNKLCEAVIKTLKQLVEIERADPADHKCISKLHLQLFEKTKEIHEQAQQESAFCCIHKLAKQIALEEETQEVLIIEDTEEESLRLTSW